MRSLRINILLPFGAVTGGIRAVVEIADRLHDQGHAVLLLYPEMSVCSRRNRLLRRLPGGRPFMRRNEGDLSWARPRAGTLCVPDLTASHVPEGDVVLATAWQTAEFAARYPASRGTRVYFVQHYEVWSGPPRLVDRTWKAGFRIAVTAPWLAKLARERFGIDEVDHVSYGVDPDLFRPDPEGAALRRGGFRVGMLCHPEAWKGTADGLEAVRELRARGVDARPVLFGTSPPLRGWPETGVERELHLDPPQERLRVIYSSLDAFLCPSHTETGPLTVLEAMACGVPVVSTEVGNVALWTGEGRHALLARVGQPGSQARLLERLFREPGLARGLAEKGRERAVRFTWDETARAMEGVLRRAVLAAEKGESP